MHLNVNQQSISKQHGAALLILLLIIILSGSAFFISTAVEQYPRIDTQNKTSLALAQAKRALLDYATAYYFTQSNGDYGFLPCPETINSSVEGLSVLNCAISGARHVNQLGRLPWKTLQIPELMDGSGECLWYAMSGSFSPSPRALMLNDDTPGMLKIYNEDGSLNIGSSAESRVVAIVISPGAPLVNQSRIDSRANLRCKVPHNLINVKNYLESHQNINNAAINIKNPNTIDSFISSSGFINQLNLNDRIISITREEIFNTIKSQPALYKQKITDLGLALSQCLIDFSQTAAAHSVDCDNLDVCYLTCENTASLCDASAESNLEKTQCKIINSNCQKICRNNCLNNEATLTPVYRLPWPAPVDLKSDYRINKNYSDQLATSSYLGRLAYLTPRSQSAISKSTPISVDDNIFQSCALPLIRPDLFNLWENWKDHWFYIVGKDFSADVKSAPLTPCVNCPQVNGKSYAAIIIFSGERIQSQLRRTKYTEINKPLIESSKANLANYLEGNNLLNINDTQGKGHYSRKNSNDLLFCIPENLTSSSVSIECGF